jgi:hypothetical protein
MNSERESFDLFFVNEYRQNPALNLEDALDMYIKKYSLVIRHSLDEPKMITDKRTKLRILEESDLSNTKYCNSSQFHQYITELRMFVEALNSLSPEALRAVKKREENEKRIFKLAYISIIARIIAAGLLVWSLARHPYDYYTLMRWIVCATAGYLTYVSYDSKKTPWVWVFGGIAILFNPIIPIHLKKTTWAAIDVVAGVIMIVSILFIREKAKGT